MRERRTLKRGMSIVLIETLWNVNSLYTIAAQYPSFVLIETLWNVNISTRVRESITMRINRNIVECKCFLLILSKYCCQY